MNRHPPHTHTHAHTQCHHMRTHARTHTRARTHYLSRPPGSATRRLARTRTGTTARARPSLSLFLSLPLSSSLPPSLSPFFFLSSLLLPFSLSSLATRSWPRPRTGTTATKALSTATTARSPLTTAAISAARPGGITCGAALRGLFRRSGGFSPTAKKIPTKAATVFSR